MHHITHDAFIKFFFLSINAYRNVHTS